MRHFVIAAAALLTTACAPPAAEVSAHDQFFAALNTLCGQSFAGRVVTTDAADADFANAQLVMHVRECSANEIRIPFHVGEDRSRTWVISRTDAGLRLKHDHRHEDGSEDVLTQYGGDTIDEGEATRQEFPADEFSKQLFRDNDIPVSVDNVWAMEVHPERMFAYELRRPNRHFRVEFDLSQAVPAPAPPWGSE